MNYLRFRIAVGWTHFKLFLWCLTIIKRDSRFLHYIPTWLFFIEPIRFGWDTETYAKIRWR